MPRSPAAEVAALLAPLRERPRRGVRIGCVGFTGSGKSFALRKLAALAAPTVDVVYALDDSENAGDWGGQRRLDLGDCRARPLVARRDGGSNVVVLEGDPFRRITVDAEAVAADAWALAARGHTCLVALDELRRACARPQHWTVAQGELARMFTEGRKVGLSCMWATNFPQEVPREALSSSDVLYFGLDGRDVEYLVRKRMLDDAHAAAIVRLQRGEFVLKRMGAPGAATVFRF